MPVALPVELGTTKGNLDRRRERINYDRAKKDKPRNREIEQYKEGIQ